MESYSDFQHRQLALVIQNPNHYAADFKHIPMAFRINFSTLSPIFLSYIFKGYLRHKTITSQNVLSESQIKIFLLGRKIMFRSLNIQVLVFLTIP